MNSFKEKGYGVFIVSEQPKVHILKYATLHKKETNVHGGDGGGGGGGGVVVVGWVGVDVDYIYFSLIPH